MQYTYNTVNVMWREKPSEYFYLNNKLTYIANRTEFGCNDKKQPQQPRTIMNKQDKINDPMDSTISIFN